MIIIKSKKEIEAMREGGIILAEIMNRLGEMVVPGNNTEEINKLAKKLVFDMNGVPVFEGYGDPKNPYPAAVCVSINEEIVHGIPSSARIIKNGDIVKLDIGMKYENLITDMARTFPAGEISADVQKLLNATKESLNEGIKIIKAGVKLSDYSRTIEHYVKLQGFSVVRELVGHGVGKKLHEDPYIPNFDMHGKEVILQAGMALALEPMVNAGTRYIKLLKDGWTYVTKDGKLSAHFEDTILVTENGAEILTRI